MEDTATHHQTNHLRRVVWTGYQQTSGTTGRDRRQAIMAKCDSIKFEIESELLRQNQVIRDALNKICNDGVKSAYNAACKAIAEVEI
jgi:hypothetical protein